MKTDTHFQNEIDKILKKTAQSRLDWSDGDPDPLSNPQDLSVLEGEEREGVRTELEYEESDLKNLLSKLEKMHAMAENDISQETLLQYMQMIEEAELKPFIDREPPKEFEGSVRMGHPKDQAFSRLLQWDKNIEDELFGRGNLDSDNVDIGYYVDEITTALRFAIDNLKEELGFVEKNFGMEEPIGAEIESIPAPVPEEELEASERSFRGHQPDYHPPIPDPHRHLGPLEVDRKQMQRERDLSESGAPWDSWASLKVLEELEKIASRLDSEGKYEDADAIERAMVRLAEETHLDSNGTTWTNKGPTAFPKGYVTWASSDGGTSMNLMPGELPEPSSHTGTGTTAPIPSAPQAPVAAPQSAASVGEQIGSWFSNKLNPEI